MVGSGKKFGDSQERNQSGEVEKDIEVIQVQVAWPHCRKSASRQFTRLFRSIAKQLDVFVFPDMGM